MSRLSIQLSNAPAAAHWGKNAVLSFDNESATIHLLSEDPQHRTIRRAARILDGLNLDFVTLCGKWQIEQQWAFAYSFTSSKKQHHIQWADDENSNTLTQRYQALVFTRNQTNATPEDLSPEKLASSSVEWLTSLSPSHVSAKQWVGEELVEQQWHGLYNVGRGSQRPPVMLEVDFNPTDDPLAPVSAALVGKGITFDSGGYSIKGSEGMLHMKCDMGGAAMVTGGLGLAIMQGLDKRVKLYLCCAENLISGHAYKLGDVITYKNGTTVEIVNTDAEGRLVLCDVLWYAQERFNPAGVIDLATLTGAIIIGLGHDNAGVFSNDDTLCNAFLKAAQTEGEGAWRMPLGAGYDKLLKSRIADMKNIGGRPAGSITAAQFLQRFIKDGTPWIHLDIAGVASVKSETALAPVGATGWGVAALNRLISNLYETE
jgi:PepB aminopeptidase